MEKTWDRDEMLRVLPLFMFVQIDGDRSRYSPSFEDFFLGSPFSGQVLVLGLRLRARAAPPSNPSRERHGLHALDEGDPEIEPWLALRTSPSEWPQVGCISASEPSGGLSCSR